MIGRYLAPAYPPPRRWILFTWGVPDIHMRQKWQAVWPRLRPHARRSLRCLDAGCGEGFWTLELGRRFPNWQVTGLDRDRRALGRGRGLHARLDAGNVEWVERGFLGYQPEEPFDLVLSINSAHYMIEAGMGDALFDRFCEWLRPGGEMILVVARCLAETPAMRHLAFPVANRQVTTSVLLNLITRPEFERCEMVPFVGAPGVWAKQIDLATARRRLLHSAVYPLEILLDLFDRLPHAATLATPSAFWLLRLQKRPSSPLETPYA